MVEKDEKPSAKLDHRRIVLTVRPGSTQAKREEVMQQWSRHLLHEAVPSMIQKWEAMLGGRISGYFLQHMKTKWGGCNPRASNYSVQSGITSWGRVRWKASCPSTAGGPAEPGIP